MVDGKPASASLFQERSPKATEHLALLFSGGVELVELWFGEESLPLANE